MADTNQEQRIRDLLHQWSRKAKDSRSVGSDFHSGVASALLEAIRDLRAMMEPVEPQPTWCRAHGTHDLCPEHCPKCKGYFHGDVLCKYAHATDQGGAMPGFEVGGTYDT